MKRCSMVDLIKVNVWLLIINFKARQIFSTHLAATVCNVSKITAYILYHDHR